MPIKIIRICGILISSLLYCTAIHPQSMREETKFEVCSIRVLSDEEASTRSPDFIGPNIAVRMRLSTGRHGISFYGWTNAIVPGMFKVSLEAGKTYWFFGGAGVNKLSASPGIQKVLYGSKGMWISLPPNSAIEWEELDSSSFAGEMHAFTIFVRNKDEHETELLSTPYVVPVKGTPNDAIGVSTTLPPLNHESGHIDPPKQH